MACSVQRAYLGSGTIRVAATCKSFLTTTTVSPNGRDLLCRTRGKERLTVCLSVCLSLVPTVPRDNPNLGHEFVATDPATKSRNKQFRPPNAFARYRADCGHFQDPASRLHYTDAHLQPRSRGPIAVPLKPPIGRIGTFLLSTVLVRMCMPRNA